MTIFERKDFERLAKVDHYPSVSIYIPTHQSGMETLEGQDAKLLKDKVHDAREWLIRKGYDKKDADAYLKQAYELVEDNTFWRYQLDGLAVFISNNVFEYYRVPLSFDELVTVNQKFDLKPLLPLLSENDRFYLLTLSQHNVRLFEGNVTTLREIDISEKVPQNFEDVLGKDEQEDEIQHHAMPTSGTGGATQPVYHSHRSEAQEKQRELRKFFSQVDEGLQEILPSDPNDRTPLVIAGVDYLLPIYREVNSYKYLLPEGIQGNQDHEVLDRLHEKAWKIISSHFDDDVQKTVERFNRVYGAGKASEIIDDIIVNAQSGLVDTLFLERGVDFWGQVDLSQNMIEKHKNYQQGDECLLNLSAVNTILTGGQVYLLDRDNLPSTNSPAAAIFRN